MIVRRREVFGYCMFDFANSSYTTLISTVAYSVYFRQAVVGAHDPRGDFLWSVAQVMAYLILIASAPVFGALADYSGRKKRFLLMTTIQTVAACALLAMVGPGDVALGMILLIVGMVGFEGGYVFYNAFLPEVSTPETIGRVSGWSWGMGFIGGLIALVACMSFLARPLLGSETGALDPEAVGGYRISFVIVAAFFAVFAVPTFLFLRERAAPRSLASPWEYVTAGFRRVADTISHLRRYRETAKYVASTLFFYGGIDTVIKFSAIYASVTFGIDGKELSVLFIFMNVIAVPGTLFAGYAADRIGGKRALTITLVAWIVLLIFGALAQSRITFWIMASGVAIGMGSTQAIGRSYMAQISPPSRESEFFGFYILCSKIGSIFSLLLFGLISSGSGNQRLAVLSVVPFFVVGLVLMLWIDDSRARQAAAAPGSAT
jgi:UMF1 family MFS transporter